LGGAYLSSCLEFRKETEKSYPITQFDMDQNYSIATRSLASHPILDELERQRPARVFGDVRADRGDGDVPGKQQQDLP
jgi:hypothetical protein